MTTPTSNTAAGARAGTITSHPPMPLPRRSSQVVTTLTRDIHPVLFRKGMSWKIEETEDRLSGQTVFQEILSIRAHPQLYATTTTGTTAAASATTLDLSLRLRRRRLTSLTAGVSAREVVGEIAGVTTREENVKVSAKGKEIKPVPNAHMAGEVVKRKKHGVVTNLSDKVTVHNKVVANQVATSSDPSSTALTASASSSSASTPAASSSTSAVVNRRRWGAGGIDSLKDTPHPPSVVYDKVKVAHDNAKMKGSKATGKHEGRREAYKEEVEGGAGTGTAKEGGVGSDAAIHPLIGATWQPPPSTSSASNSQPGQGLGIGTAPGQGLGLPPSSYVIRVRAHRVIVCAKETIDGTPHPLDLTTTTPTPHQRPIVSPVNKDTTATKGTTSTSTSTGNNNNNNNNNNNHHHTNHTTTASVDGIESVSVSAQWTGSFTDPRFRAPLAEHALTGQVSLGLYVCRGLICVSR